MLGLFKGTTVIEQFFFGIGDVCAPLDALTERQEPAGDVPGKFPHIWEWTCAYRLCKGPHVSETKILPLAALQVCGPL